MRPLIACDLDGTLIDSQRDLAESANEMLAGYGAQPLAVADVAAMVGDGARQLVARTLQAARVEADVSTALEQFLGIYSRRLFVHTRLYEGIEETIRAIEPLASLAVLTNKPEGLARRLLDGFGISSAFRWIVGGDSGFPRKPDPAGLRHLLDQAGIEPNRCLMVGDSMVDVETARRAGTAVCVVLYGFGHLRQPIVMDGTEAVVQRPVDLLRTVSAFLAENGHAS